MKVLVIGHASYDISVPVDSFPLENEKHRFNDIVKCGGGPAANAAHLLGKWNILTTFAGVVGNDSFGKLIIDEMKSVNINTNYLETNYDHDTSLSFILINKNNKSRTVFNCATQHLKLKKRDFVDTPDIILIDGHDYMASKTAIEKFPNAISIIDAGRATDEVIRLCKMCKYIVCSKKFAETLTKTTIDFNNTNTITKVYTDLKSQFKGEIAITLEDRGVLYLVDSKIKILPAIKIDVVDTTGAGDIFHGAFTYGIAKKYSFEDSLKIANIAAGMSVTKMGGKLAIPSFNEFMEFSKSLGLELKSQETNSVPNIPPINQLGTNPDKTVNIPPINQKSSPNIPPINSNQ